MNKLISMFFVIMHTLSLASFSMNNEKTISHSMSPKKTCNNTCHYCRKNIKNYMTNAKLVCCGMDCKKTFCKECVEYMEDEIEFTGYKQCPCCLSLCCCNFYECIKKHSHCFTYNRTKKRHIAKKPLWMKCRKQQAKKWIFIDQAESRLKVNTKKCIAYKFADDSASFMYLDITTKDYLSQDELEAINVLCTLGYASYN